MLPTWFQSLSKVFVSSLLVLGLISVNPFTVSADTVYIPTSITGDSRLSNVNVGGANLTKMYGTSTQNKNTELYYYVTFSEPFVLTSAEFSVVINNSRTTTIHVYGSESSSFSTNVELGSATRTNTGMITVTPSNNTTAYQYYVVGFNSNYLNNSNQSVWSIDGSFSNNGGRAYRFNGTTASVTQYTLTTAVSPSGSGSVTGGGTYDDRTSVTLTAIPNTGYVFDHWENDSNVNLGSYNPYNYVITRDLTITAFFVQDVTPPAPTTYTITTNVSPSGSGSVTGGGTYAENTVISLQAVANTGYTFSSWSDGVTSNPRSITVSGNASYTANFTANAPTPTYYTWSASSNNDSFGSVSPMGGTSQSGNTITVTATANTGYIFDHWVEVGSGNNLSSSNPYSFTLTSNKSIQAVFIVDPNYVPASVLLLVHKNIYNYNYPTDPVVITTFTYPNAHTVNNNGLEIIKTLTPGTDFPMYVDYAVSYNYSVTLYSFKGVRDQNNNHYGNNVTVQSGVDYDIIRSNYQVFVSSAYTGTGSGGQQYYVVTVVYPLPDVTSVYTLNNAYTAGSYTAGSNTYFPDNVGTSTDQLILSGDTGSTSASNGLSTSTTNMSTGFSSYFNYEDGFLTDMNDSLEDIDMEPDLFLNNGFFAGANWVRTQFDNLTVANPFGSVITFTLLLGLALMILGIFR